MKISDRRSSGLLHLGMFVHTFPLISETFILNQIVSLLNQGHEVTIFAFSRGDLSKVHPLVDQYALLDRCNFIYTNKVGTNFSFSEIIRLLGTPRWISIDGFRVLKRLMRPLPRGWSRMSALRVLTTALTNRFDLLHCQFGDLGVRVLTLQTEFPSLSGKIVTAFRGHDLTQTKRFTPSFYSQLAEEGTIFLPVSEYLADRLRSYGFPHDRIRVVRSGLAIEQFQFRTHLPVRKSTLELTCVGRLVPMKGTEYAIRALMLIKQVRDNVRLNVIGDGPLRHDLECLAREIGVDEHVKFLGAQVHGQVVKHMLASDIVITPSVTASNGEQEGIPNVLKEAMALGVPVIATRHSGIPELVKHQKTGWLVPERDALALARAVADVLDLGDVEQITKQARIHVEQQYALEVVHNVLSEAYARALS